MDATKRLYLWVYTNPNPRTILLEELFHVWKAESVADFSSGMGAITNSLITLISKGDHVIL